MSALAAIPMSLDKRMGTMRDFGAMRRLPSGLEIPAVSVWINKLGFAPIPAYGIGNQVQLIQHTVPTNYEAVYTGIVLGTIIGSGNQAGPGDIVWTVDVDRQLGDATTIGYPEKDFGAVQFPLGSLIDGPWPVEWKYESGQVIRVKAYATNNVTPGAPNWVVAALVGWEWPTKKADLL